MRIEIGTDQADHWFHRVCEALAGVDQEYERVKEEERANHIASENRFRKWLPFVKMIPESTAWEDLKGKPYNFELRFLRGDRRILVGAFRGLEALVTGNIKTVVLSREEMDDINFYARKYAESVDTQ